MGYAQAQYRLGLAYKTKEFGVKTDYHKVFEFMKLTANQGKQFGVKPDYHKVFEFMKLAANQEYAPALYELGLLYRKIKPITITHNK